MIASVPVKSVNDHNVMGDLVRWHVERRREPANMLCAFPAERKFSGVQASDSKPFFGAVQCPVALGRAGGLLTNNSICSVYVLIPGSKHWTSALFSSKQMPLRRRLMR